MTKEAKPEGAGKEDPKQPETWAEDQKKRGYYYDDACGYETFDPTAEDDDEDPDTLEESAGEY